MYISFAVVNILPQSKALKVQNLPTIRATCEKSCQHNKLPKQNKLKCRRKSYRQLNPEAVQIINWTICFLEFLKYKINLKVDTIGVNQRGIVCICDCNKIINSVAFEFQLRVVESQIFVTIKYALRDLQSRDSYNLSECKQILIRFLALWAVSLRSVADANEFFLQIDFYI